MPRGKRCHKVSDELKEWAAISLMQSMLNEYSKKHNISFQDAMDEFVKSLTYLQLFKFDNGIWKEGTSYLLEVYEGEIASKK